MRTQKRTGCHCGVLRNERKDAFGGERLMSGGELTRERLKAYQEMHPGSSMIGEGLGLLGGALGCLLALPLNGVDTGTMNFQTFTEVAFAFQVTPAVMQTAVTFSLVLGLLGGTWPALRAALMRPTAAMRRE